jgi:dTMP kinase
MTGTGTFITFEGGEGCGKSTHIQRIADRLRAQGRSVLTLREPGGTGVGEQIRHVLQHSRQSAAMTPEAEVLLFSASRAQLVRELIRPALAQGEVVLCDRFFDSTTVYQGAGRKIDAHSIAFLNQFAVGDCLPHLTVLIDLDPRIGLERVKGRELFDRMENESLAFHERVRQGYLALARREPQRIKIIDGNQTIDTIAGQIWELVRCVI